MPLHARYGKHVSKNLRVQRKNTSVNSETGVVDDEEDVDREEDSENVFRRIELAKVSKEKGRVYRK